MLLNLTNHPSANWSEEQKNTAIHQYDSVQDLPFPQIDPNATSDDLEKLAEEYEHKIRKLDAKAVHIMGEMTFTFKLVTRLKAIGIPCVASTTERIVQERNNEAKVSIFRFVSFREY